MAAAETAGEDEDNDCPTCKEWMGTRPGEHKCPPRWHVTIEDGMYDAEHYGRDAYDAAEKAVEEYDATGGEYTLATKNERLTVTVTGPIGGEEGTKILAVEGEWSPFYVAYDIEAN